jgi:hypothetical protein
MTQDEELFATIVRIRLWCRAELEQHQPVLPAYEFSVVKKRYDAFQKRANDYYKDYDLRSLKGMLTEMPFFMLPWEATVWYASHKKKG